MDHNTVRNQDNPKRRYDSRASLTPHACYSLLPSFGSYRSEKELDIGSSVQLIQLLVMWVIDIIDIDD
jgi:hypothetical protein